MANKKYHHSKALNALGLFVLVMLMQRGGATEFKVGGSNGWTVPTDSKALSLNQWARTKRFQIGDTLCELTIYIIIVYSCISKFNKFVVIKFCLFALK